MSESEFFRDDYIGEYGKSEKYNVVWRIKQHFANSGTLRRASINLMSFNNVMPNFITAYIFELDDQFKNSVNRESLEAWLIYLTCHHYKIQDNRFAVTKYISPRFDYSKLAKKIINDYMRGFS